MKILAMVGTLLALAATLPKDVAQYPSCALCQMNREKFANSRALIEWGDDSRTPVCSLNCVAAALAQQPTEVPKTVLIADHDSKELLLSGEAFWVVGGSERGVMTPEPKWAFGTKEAAERFVGRFGGRLTTWDEALARAKADVKMRRKE